MNLGILLGAPLSIQLHVAAVLVAIITVLIIWRLPKGTRYHKWLGRTWAAAMAIAAISSFFIQTLDWLWGFSPIHLISVFVLFSLVKGIRAARRRDIKAHKSEMIWTAAMGLGVAGLFAFAPGRMMFAVLFGG